MSELRQDGTTGAWVIVAPERGRRPQQVLAAATARTRVAAFDPACPFCPGNENALPGIVEETACDAPPGWRVRVVPNKHPALRPDVPGLREPMGDPPAVPGYGFHEVVIETPRHDAHLGSLSRDEASAVVAAYRRRFVALGARPGVRSVVLFRNHGSRSGASLTHPHAQLVALGMTPPGLRSRAAWAQRSYREHGRCVVCDELTLERQNGRRIVDESPRFAVLVPFAASCPFELRIVPKRHQAAFSEIGHEEEVELGEMLRRAAQALRAALGDPPYNLVVDSVGPRGAFRPGLHWRIRIAPGLVTPGGFELAAAMPINPSRPEDDADALRRALARAPRS